MRLKERRIRQRIVRGVEIDNRDFPAIKQITLLIRKTVIGTIARRKAMQRPQEITLGLVANKVMQRKLYT